MDVGVKPRAVRLLSGHPIDVEDAIAHLGTDYAVTHWHFYNWEDKPFVTAVLIHGSVIRQMQIAMAGQMGPRGH